jgi:hypothetical protein
LKSPAISPRNGVLDQKEQIIQPGGGERRRHREGCNIQRDLEIAGKEFSYKNHPSFIRSDFSPYIVFFFNNLRSFQSLVLLRAWAVGEGIALVNSILKIVLKIRIYDYF